MTPARRRRLELARTQLLWRLSEIDAELAQTDTRLCAYDGAPFTPARADALYCSSRHRQAGYRRVERWRRAARDAGDRVCPVCGFTGPAATTGHLLAAHPGPCRTCGLDLQLTDGGALVHARTHARACPRDPGAPDTFAAR